MIITLSPAKMQDFETPLSVAKSSDPIFEKEADELYRSLEGATPQEISKLMKINPKMGHDVYQFINGFQLPQVSKRQAIFAYNGIAYQGLDAWSMSDADLDFAQEHLVHITGLYGVLRPLDLIKPYRLEMITPLVNDRGANLYDFWTDTITKYMGDRLMKDDNIWINLSSKEYSKAVNKKLLPKGVKIITPIFMQETAKGPKQIVVYAKKARGMMSRYIIQNRIKEVENIKAFDTEGYHFAPHLSNESEWIFIR